MARNKADEKDFLRISREMGVEYGDVKSAVLSFFDSIVADVRNLPLNNPRRIYDKEKFSEFGRVWAIPYLGRIGPSYSRYLQWRANESRQVDTVRRSDYKSVFTSEEIESLARSVLHEWKEGDPMVSGRTLQSGRRAQAYPFHRVWIVGKDGKKQARQVIPKKKSDVQSKES